MGMGRSVELNQSLKEGQNWPFRGSSERRENRGLVVIEEAPDSVISLATRVQYPSRMNQIG